MEPAEGLHLLQVQPLVIAGVRGHVVLVDVHVRLHHPRRTLQARHRSESNVKRHVDRWRWHGIQNKLSADPSPSGVAVALGAERYAHSHLAGRSEVRVGAVLRHEEAE
eukprot:3582594-Rhodomonas_salina.1